MQCVLGRGRVQSVDKDIVTGSIETIEDGNQASQADGLQEEVGGGVQAGRAEEEV